MAESLIPCQKDHLLIVDDEKMVRQIFRRLLVTEFPNLTIELASDGQEALSLFQARHHTVIMMDLHMPVMDGEMAYQEIERWCGKERWAMPAMVFCTGYDASLGIRQTIEANSRYCMLRKPVKSQVLIETIRARLTD